MDILSVQLPTPVHLLLFVFYQLGISYWLNVCAILPSLNCNWCKEKL